MHALSAWFTKNPVAANLVMFLILIGGFFTIKSIRIEGFPALPSNSVTISTVYSGASADQVDRGVSRKIEKALEGMPGIKKTSSFSEAEMSSVMVQKISRFDMDRFQNEVTTRINAIYNLPQRAERPIITRDEFNVEALLVQIYGDTDRKTLQKVSRQVKEELLGQPEITKIIPFGLLPYEISIDVDDEKMRAFSITLTEVAGAIQNASLNYHTGSIESSAGKVVIRADQKAFSYEEFAAIPVRTLKDGTRLLVKDVAKVIDGFQDEGLFARFQGKPSVGMMIYTSKKGNLIEVSKAAHKAVKTLRPQLPAGIEIDVWGEYSIYMKERLSLLATNALQGLMIVFGLLTLFLNVRLAFWVAMGIPLSIGGTLILMGDRFLGHSLNDITTFGMIIVLGILVDDAIVVGESVFESRETIKDPIEGTIKGVHRVSTATIFGCFTTIAAFYPLLLIDNDLGKLFAGFSVVVISALLVSLMESKLILPAHLAAVRMEDTRKPKYIFKSWKRIQNFFQSLLSFVNNTVYQPVLKNALRHRYATLTILLTIAMCGISMINNGWIRAVFFPDVPGQIITVNMKMKNGSPKHLTASNLQVIENMADSLNKEIMTELSVDEPPIVKIMTALTSPYDAEIYAELQPEKERSIETMETVERWREKVGTLEGTEELIFAGSMETGGGFAVTLGARDDAVLEDAVKRLITALKNLEGVHSIRDDLRQGSPQIRLRLKPEAQHLGVTTADLAMQIGDAFGGLEVQKLQREADEVRVVVKYKEERRRYMRDILDTRIQTAQGKWLPLLLVATVESGYIPSSIYRQNSKRLVFIRASLDKDIISPTEAMKWIKKNAEPEIVSLYPQLTIKGAGELEEMGEIRGGMIRGLIIIVILIYTLLAIPLKSYWQPFVIMSVVPFGFVGAAIGHFVMGFPLSILSFFGMMAVMGIVVNDSLVMLTRFNDIRKEEKSLEKALVMAGSGRFRAIFLTTITTVCGLLPLLSETSEQAQYLIPAAISLAWGELFATPITLIIVPLFIHMGNDLTRAGRLLKQLVWFQPFEKEKNWR